jgi:hypothetical protein
MNVLALIFLWSAVFVFASTVAAACIQKLVEEHHDDPAPDPGTCGCGAPGNHLFDGSHAGIPQPEEDELDWDKYDPLIKDGVDIGYKPGVNPPFKKKRGR